MVHTCGWCGGDPLNPDNPCVCGDREEDDEYQCDQCGGPTGAFPVVSNLCEDCRMHLAVGVVEDAGVACRCMDCGYTWETNAVYRCPGCGSEEVARKDTAYEAWVESLPDPRENP